MSTLLCNKKYTKPNRNLPKYRNDTPNSSSEESIDNQDDQNIIGELDDKKKLPEFFFENGLEIDESDLYEDLKIENANYKVNEADKFEEETQVRIEEINSKKDNIEDLNSSKLLK